MIADKIVLRFNVARRVIEAQKKKPRCSFIERATRLPCSFD